MVNCARRQRRQTVEIIADLAEHVPTMDRPNSGETGNRSLGVLVEHGGEFGFERGDDIAHRGDDLDQPEGGNLDWRGLTQHLGGGTDHHPAFCLVE